MPKIIIREDWYQLRQFSDGTDERTNRRSTSRDKNYGKFRILLQVIAHCVNYLAHVCCVSIISQPQTLRKDTSPFREL